MVIVMKKIILILLAVGMLAGCGAKPASESPSLNATTVPETTAVPETTLPPETTEETIAETTVPETEPQPEVFTLTFVGDCTLGTDKNSYGAPTSFVSVIGENYDYPFQNVVEYFENDDFTMVNLEGVLADSGASSGGTFSFRGPTAYTQILTGSSVEAVTLANNHTMDYYRAGYDSTLSALEDAGVAYVEHQGTLLYTTDSGLTLGFCAAWYTVDLELVTEQIASLRAQGAEVIVMALHWGAEGAYRPIPDQEKLAHQLIDAGVDILYGHHSHVLQKIEEYEGGIIYYSLGNFCFGGHTWPRDLDSVIVQQEIIREPDGNVHRGGTNLIPVSISSTTPSNNFQPTPYEPDSEEYLRVLSKLDGTFTGANLKVSYG